MPMLPKGHRPALLDLNAAKAMLRAAEATPAPPITLLAQRPIALTAVRPGEARAARWAELEALDGDAPLWRIPAERMKTHRDHAPVEHVVPLSRQAIETLATARMLTAHMPFVFPSRNAVHKPMPENALGYLLNRAGYHGHHVPHSWHATFSTVMYERYREDRAVIYLMLAHVAKSVEVQVGVPVCPFRYHGDIKSVVHKMSC
jgi:integrase